MKRYLLAIIIAIVFLSAAAAQSGWIRGESIDPITDKKSKTIGTFCSEQKSLFVFRYIQEDGESYWEQFIIWDSYINVDTYHSLTVRFDLLPAFNTMAISSTNGRSSFFLDDTIFVQAMQNENTRMAVRLTDKSNQTFTAVFNISGLLDELIVMRE